MPTDTKPSLTAAELAAIGERIEAQRSSPDCPRSMFDDLDRLYAALEQMFEHLVLPLAGGFFCGKRFYPTRADVIDALLGQGG